MPMARLMPLAALIALGATGASAQSDDTFVAAASEGVVTTTYGDLIGFSDHGIHTFRGVPYAQAERFGAPRPPDAWEGLRLAMNYGEICPYPTMEAVAQDEQFNPHRYLPESEACQFLNVWTPGLGDGGRRPVLVWLHGGGFTNGSSIEGASYEGANLARLGDMVVVSLNHRLNVLGALDLSGYGEGYASNPGMRDVVAALQWVQANIEAFGGDPGNVTIMGQSGGGGKVRFLLGAPEAQDLFDKAIVMSGAGNVAAYPQEVAQAVAERTVANLGLTPETIAGIEAVPYEELLAAGTLAMEQAVEAGVAESLNWRPTIDGTFMPADPVEMGWTQHSADKPMIVGNVMHESNTIINVDPAELLADNWTRWSDETATARLDEQYPGLAGPLAAAWRQAYPDRPLGELAFVNFPNRTSSLAAAAQKAETGTAPVYNYLFTWNSPVLDGIAGAWHVADVPMAFYTVDLVPQAFGGGEDARSMAFDVSRAWIAFARTGDPNHPGLPEWPAFTPENGATMIFDDYSTVGSHHDRELIEVATSAEQG